MLGAGFRAPFAALGIGRVRRIETRSKNADNRILRFPGNFEALTTRVCSPMTWYRHVP